ncbi:MAG: TonB-dependent receptor [Bacteroidia bacterium]
MNLSSPRNHSAQVEGQQAAINQQINSNTIVNVVSKDKIQSLPDQNAAETVGRLPGISVQRDAGEGTKIVVRGLSPRFNSITVNGERIPSTDPEDRSVDLSMVSTDALEGIEVFKALTPDKDGDAVGGTVNFVIKKASDEFRGSVKLQGGYNSQQSELGQPRGSFNLSNRFFNKKLGIILTGNFQRANRSSDVLNATYTQNGVDMEGRSKIFVTNLNLSDRLETRYRYGGSLAMDWDLKNGSIVLSSFLGRTEREEFRRRRRYRISAAYQEYDVRTREINTFLSSNSLSGTHNLGFLNLELSWRASLSLTDQDRPYTHEARFRELAAFRADIVEDKGPELIPEGAKNRIDQTWFKDAYLDVDDIRDRNTTTQVDLKLPFKWKTLVEGYLKFGGKLRDKYRFRNLDRDWTKFDGINDIIADHPGQFALDNENRMLMSNFISDFQPDDFLKGEYEFGPGLDIEAVNQFAKDYRSYYTSDGQFDLQDYSATENIRAAYIMSEIFFFNKKLMILPGARVEQTQTSYKGYFGLPNSSGEIGSLRDTLGGQNYTELLPMLHLRYKFAKWVDLRLAATRTLSRPNYFNLVPWYRINDFETFLEQGEPNLKHTKVWNYDAFLSFYNKLGLVTIGAFYKELEDIDYIRSSKVIPEGRSITYDLLKPENAPGISTAQGIEVEIQTNFRFLPSPFDGILLGINYSRVFSETFFPLLVNTVNPLPPFNAIFKDTVRTGRIPGQSDHIFNASLGYEKKGFTARVSCIYQGASLGFVGQREELDGYTDEFFRWDLSMKQKLGNTGVTIFLNVNNISNTPEREFLGSRLFPTRKEYFGWTGDLGVNVRF